MNGECFHCDFVSNFYQVLCLHIFRSGGGTYCGYADNFCAAETAKKYSNRSRFDGAIIKSKMHAAVFFGPAYTRLAFQLNGADCKPHTQAPWPSHLAGGLGRLCHLSGLVRDNNIPVLICASQRP